MSTPKANPPALTDPAGVACELITVSVLVVGPENRAREVAAELDDHLSAIHVVYASSLVNALSTVHEMRDTARHGIVPLVIISSGMGDIDTAISRLAQEQLLAHSRYMLITDNDAHTDVADSIDRGRLVAVIGMPWVSELLAIHVRSQIDRWLRRNRPKDPCTAHLLAHTTTVDPTNPRSTGDLLSRLELDSQEMVEVLLAGIERVLGKRPRLIMPAGVRLTRQGSPVDAVYLVLRGAVALRRTSAGGDILLHHASSGPIIGLLSMAQRDRAIFTSTATTEVEVVRISIEQIDHVLVHAPEVSAALAVLSITALSTRLVRAEQLNVEKSELTGRLKYEQQELARTLKELEATRSQLVGQARFAALGELAAGLAHELNNPVAALTRAAQFAGDDLEKLLLATPRAERSLHAVRENRNRSPRSTRDERALIKSLTPIVGNRDTAKRMVQAGVETEGEARILSDDPQLEQRLTLLEASAGVGRSLHNIDVAAKRIAALVQSLRSYARPDNVTVDDVDIHEGLDDTLSLTGHRLRGIDIERNYGKIVPIRCYPSQLEQVWTNLLVNAAEAMEGSGKITVTTQMLGLENVQIRIIDNGPGIDPTILKQIFEPHFSTKAGRIRFGLGMGLSLCRRFIGNHGGTIEAKSTPGHTELIVTLPVGGPHIEEETP